MCVWNGARVWLEVVYVDAPGGRAGTTVPFSLKRVAKTRSRDERRVLKRRA